LRQFHTSPQAQGAFLRFFTRPWIDASGQRRDPRMTTGQAMSHLKALRIAKPTASLTLE
jgi:hypothetical protein